MTTKKIEKLKRALFGTDRVVRNAVCLALLLLFLCTGFAASQESTSKNRGKEAATEWSALLVNGGTEEELQLIAEEARKLAQDDLWASFYGLLDLKTTNKKVLRIMDLMPAREKEAVRTIARFLSQRSKASDRKSTPPLRPTHIPPPGKGLANWTKPVARPKAVPASKPAEKLFAKGTVMTNHSGRSRMVIDGFRQGKHKVLWLQPYADIAPKTYFWTPDYIARNYRVVPNESLCLDCGGRGFGDRTFTNHEYRLPAGKRTTPVEIPRPKPSNSQYLRTVSETKWVECFYCKGRGTLKR